MQAVRERCAKCVVPLSCETYCVRFSKLFRVCGRRRACAARGDFSEKQAKYYRIFKLAARDGQRALECGYKGSIAKWICALLRRLTDDYDVTAGSIMSIKCTYYNAAANLSFERRGCQRRKKQRRRLLWREPEETYVGVSSLVSQTISPGTAGRGKILKRQLIRRMRIMLSEYASLVAKMGILSGIAPKGKEQRERRRYSYADITLSVRDGIKHPAVRQAGIRFCSYQISF